MDALEKLSIVIVTWNGDAMLSKCLVSLAESCGAAPEIIVVDNANLESTRKIAARFENVSYVATERNLGFAGGNNVGLQRCRRAFVALLNNDTIVRREPFSTLIGYLESHEKVGIVQGTMRLPLQGGRPDACGISMTRMGCAFERTFRTLEDAGVNSVASVYAAKGALAVFRRDFPEKVGGLFHDFYFNNFEDVDFGARACLAGYEVHYVPTPAIDHLCGQSVSRLRHGDVQIQFLHNLFFTWLTVLSPCSAARSVLGWMFWSLVSGFGHLLLTRKSDGVRELAVAIARLWKSRARMVSVRREVQSLRAVTDAEIFRRVSVRKSPRYYWSVLRGELRFEE